MKNNFDYPHTCPKIDKQIKDFEVIVESDIADIETTMYNLLDKAKEAFEAVRETNEDMRKAANYQIDDLMREIEELKIQVSDLVWKNDRLNEEIERLENLLGEENAKQ